MLFLGHVARWPMDFAGQCQSPSGDARHALSGATKGAVQWYLMEDM